jgi:hypothetical protein
MPVPQLANLKCGQSLTDHGQRSTAHLIEPQTLFSLVSGEKADNHIIKYTHQIKKASKSMILRLF